MSDLGTWRCTRPPGLLLKGRMSRFSISDQRPGASVLLVQGPSLLLTTLWLLVFSGEMFVRSIFFRLKYPVSQNV